MDSVDLDTVDGPPNDAVAGLDHDCTGRAAGRLGDETAAAGAVLLEIGDGSLGGVGVVDDDELQPVTQSSLNGALKLRWGLKNLTNNTDEPVDF